MNALLRRWRARSVALLELEAAEARRRAEDDERIRERSRRRADEYFRSLERAEGYRWAHRKYWPRDDLPQPQIIHWPVTLPEDP